MDSSTFGLIIGWIVGVAVGVIALYLVIRFAVLHALRDHVRTSTTGVSVVSANPLPVVITEPAASEER